MGRKEITAMTCACKRCGKGWESLVAEPKKCRHCASPYWKTEPTRGRSGVVSKPTVAPVGKVPVVSRQLEKPERDDLLDILKDHDESVAEVILFAVNPPFVRPEATDQFPWEIPGEEVAANVETVAVREKTEWGLRQERMALANSRGKKPVQAEVDEFAQAGNRDEDVSQVRPGRGKKK
jgi:hypothetical protein